MDSDRRSIRNLLWVILAVMVLMVGSNFYVAMELDRNSREVASLRFFLQKQMLGPALTQADELQTRIDTLNESLTGIDSRLGNAQGELDERLRLAQDQFAARMEAELPRVMDKYVRTRTQELTKMIPEQVKEKLPSARIEK